MVTDSNHILKKKERKKALQEASLHGLPFDVFPDDKHWEPILKEAVKACPCFGLLINQ